MAIEALTTRVCCVPHALTCSLPDGRGFFEAHLGSALPGTRFFALGMAVALGIRQAGWQQTPGSDDLARRLQLHTPEPRTKNQTLVQWSDSADTVDAPSAMPPKACSATPPSASTECGKAATGKYFLKERLDDF